MNRIFKAYIKEHPEEYQTLKEGGVKISDPFEMLSIVPGIPLTAVSARVGKSRNLGE